MMCSIKKLSDLSMVTGIKMLDNADIDEESYCVLCLKEKTTWEIISKQFDVRNPRRLHRIFLDVCRLLDIEGYSQCCYFVTFINGHSHFMRVKLIRTKNKASEVLTD